MKITATNISENFDKWFGEEPMPSDAARNFEKTYGFVIKCVVSRNIPPRHETFEHMLQMGCNKFDEIFDPKSNYAVPDGTTMVFPERHLSLQEQLMLMKTIADKNKKHDGGLKELRVITSSTMLVSDMHHIRIIELPKT